MGRSEESKRKRAEYLKAYRDDPNSAYNTPEARAARAAYQKAYWARPENEERRREQQRKSKAKRPEEKRAKENETRNEYMKRYYRENETYREATKVRVKAQQAAAKAADPVAFAQRNAKYMAAWRERNPERAKEAHARSSRAGRMRAREFVVAMKTTTPCADCGEVFAERPEVMDFDHISDDKETTIGKLVASGSSPSRIMKEIVKTQLVCANCHRTRTVTRLREGGIEMEEAI